MAAVGHSNCLGQLETCTAPGTQGEPLNAFIRLLAAGQGQNDRLSKMGVDIWLGLPERNTRPRADYMFVMSTYPGTQTDAPHR